MKTHLFCSRAFAATATLFLSLMIISPPAKASFHLMQIYKVIGGVNGNTSAQAIELRMRASGQNHLSLGIPNGPGMLVALDASGNNPVTLISFSHDVLNGAQGSTVLITSSNFGSFTNSPGTFVSDFTLTNLIPASYLAAGQLDYEEKDGTVLWSISFGGSGYTGSIPTGTFNGNYGNPFAGPLPSSTTQALLFQGIASAASSNNSTDYALNSGAATFTDNAGVSFQVVPEPSTLALVAMGALFGSVVGVRARKRAV